MKAGIGLFLSELNKEQIRLGEALRLNKVCGVFSSRWFYAMLWIILSACLAFKVESNIFSILFSISTFLIYTHVLYAGYYIFKSENRANPAIIFFTGLVYFSLAMFVFFMPIPFLWFMWLGTMFIFAIFFHLIYKANAVKEYLKEYCNYKLYIEIYGIVLCFIGVMLSAYYNYYFLMAVLNLLYILKINHTIIFKKRLYRIKYEAPQIPIRPMVSIIIIAFNEEKYIGKTLESIKGQDYKDYEVIVVDDHSSDKTVEVARSFENAFPLKVVQKEVRGASRSRNYGATFAGGEILLFLDADVIIPETFLSRNIEDFRNKHLGIAGLDFRAITDNRFDNLATFFYRHWLMVVQYFNPRGIGFCLLVHQKVHKETLFDETVVMSEDFDYIRRAVMISKFRILHGARPEVSWRRFQKENRALLLFKYFFFEWHRQNIGEIRRKLLPYEFGNSR